MEQIAFDFDGPAAATELTRLLEAGEQPGPVARTRLIEAWIAVHGHFDLYRRTVHELPWLPWTIATTAPGGQLTAEQLAAAAVQGCQPTVLQVDCRPRFHDPDRESHTMLYRAGCLGCTWEGPHQHSENQAVEDAHDHVYPPWWRDLPAINRPPTDMPTAKLDKARQRVIDTYEDAVPGSTSHPAGCPVWTRRRPDQTRHHYGGVLGGYDLGRPIPPTGPTL